jgi:nitrous oxide reductase
MTYFYFKSSIEPKNIILGNGVIPDNAIEITQDQYNAVMPTLGKTCVWQDKQGELHLRDWFTKYDESTDTWIADQEAIDKDTKQKFIQSANIAYNSSYKYTNPYEWTKLTIAQQQELTVYLDALNDIINGTDITSVELPNKPNFIK